MPIVTSNDVSTDLERPPGFTAGPAAQMGMSQSARDIQRKVYPDISTAAFSIASEDVFRGARELALLNSWEITTEDPAAGTLEAVVQSRLFRFRDDVSIRVQPDGEQTRFDMRSRSRVGKSDLGANAKRVRQFLAQLRERL